METKRQKVLATAVRDLRITIHLEGETEKNGNGIFLQLQCRFWGERGSFVEKYEQTIRRRLKKRLREGTKEATTVPMCMRVSIVNGSLGNEH